MFETQGRWPLCFVCHRAGGVLALAHRNLSTSLCKLFFQWIPFFQRSATLSLVLAPFSAYFGGKLQGVWSLDAPLGASCNAVSYDYITDMTCGCIPSVQMDPTSTANLLEGFNDYPLSLAIQKVLFATMCLRAKCHMSSEPASRLTEICHCRMQPTAWTEGQAAACFIFCAIESKPKNC